MYKGAHYFLVPIKIDYCCRNWQYRVQSINYEDALADNLATAAHIIRFLIQAFPQIHT